MVRKIIGQSLAAFLVTLLVVKLARVLFDVHLPPWLYLVVPVSLVVGAVAAARRQRRT